MKRTAFILCLLLPSILHGMGGDSIQDPNLIYFGSHPVPIHLDDDSIQEMRRQLEQGIFRVGNPIEEVDPNGGAAAAQERRIIVTPPRAVQQRARRQLRLPAQRRFGADLQHPAQRRRLAIEHTAIDAHREENLDPNYPPRDPFAWEGNEDGPNPFEGEGGAIFHPFEEGYGDGNDGEFDVRAEDQGREAWIDEPFLG